MHETRRTFQSREVYAANSRLCAGMAVAVLLLMCALPSHAQSSGGSSGGQGQGQGNMHPYPPTQDVSPLAPEEADPTMVERRIRALNNERQKQIVADTDKLLKLAKELNEEVAKANSGELTADELHKIADIEKLARNVRQRMTDTVGGAPTMVPVQPVLFPTL